MLDLDSGQAIATASPLGQVLDFAGPVDRGEVGEVWRLRSTTGSWAVKVTFGDLPEGAAEVAAELQTLARSQGVPAPAVRLTSAGRCWALIGDTVVRVYDWVDLLGPDPGLARSCSARCWRPCTSRNCPQVARRDGGMSSRSGRPAGTRC